MITTDFAPNESWDDALLSIKLLIQPWKWKNGGDITIAKNNISKMFYVTSYMLHVSLFFSGRSALYFLLKSLNLLRGSEIVIQAFTCSAVVLPIKALNLKPVYVDIEKQTFSMDLAKLVNSLTRKTKVIILQHTFSLTPKYRNEVIKLAKANNLFLIEDLAHGFSNNLTIQSYSNSAILLSFGRSKALSSVTGGAIISSNNVTIQPFDKTQGKQFNNLPYPSYWDIFKILLYKPLAMLIKSTYDFYLGKIIHKLANIFSLLTKEITEKEKRGKYDNYFNKAYPNALAVLLNHQLKKFDQIQSNRARICKIYYKLSNNKQLTINNYQLIRYPLLVNNRDQVISTARKQNIFLGKWYDQVVAPKALNLNRVGYKLGSCPIAEEVCKKIINLPTNISESEAEKIIKAMLQ